MDAPCSRLFHGACKVKFCDVSDDLSGLELQQNSPANQHIPFQHKEHCKYQHHKSDETCDLPGQSKIPAILSEHIHPPRQNDGECGQEK